MRGAKKGRSLGTLVVETKREERGEKRSRGGGSPKDNQNGRSIEENRGVHGQGESKSDPQGNTISETAGGIAIPSAETEVPDQLNG